jgi:hypothetical protein
MSYRDMRKVYNFRFISLISSTDLSANTALMKTLFCNLYRVSVCLVVLNEMGRRWECCLLVFMRCAEFIGDGATIMGIFASASPSHHIVYHYNAGTSSPWASGDCYQHCLKVRVQGIFTHIVASLDTRRLRSNCALSRRLRKLNSAQVGVQYCKVNSIRIETLRDLGSSYVPEDPFQVGVECGEMYEPFEIQTHKH